MKNKILILGVVLLAIVGAIIIYKVVPVKTIINNNKNLRNEYSLLEEDNVYVYKELKEVMKIFDKGTGIIFLGFPECPWCQQYVVYLDKLAKQYNVNEVYYYNIKSIRENNTEEYQKMVAKLNDYLPYDDNGNRKIFVPAVVFIKDGKLLALDNETATINDGTKPEDYWTEEALELFNTKMGQYFEEYNKNGTCTSCN